MPSIRLSHVSFSYSSAVPLISDASLSLGAGWTGLVGTNGAGKTTLLALMAGVLPPTTGEIVLDPSGTVPVACPQRVDSLTAEIRGFAASWSRDDVRMRGRLALEPSDMDRWQTLSPGERKRWQIGAALAMEPEVLLLDEPTNHLDGEARDLLIAALVEFRGCGVIVSHDRQLLNAATTKTIRIIGGSVTLWNGGYRAARDGWLGKEQEIADRYERLAAERRKLTRRIDEQHRKTAKQDAKRKRERRSAGKHELDTRGSAATYRHERGQKTGAQTVSSMLNTLASVEDGMAGTVVRKEKGGAISIDTPKVPKGYLARHRGPVKAGDRVLFDADVAIRRGDRIRIAGPNGAGKSSLVRHLLEGLAIEERHVLHLEQETTPAESKTWMDALAALSPTDRGSVLSIFAALGSEPGSLLASDEPSPGEMRKLILAFGLGTPKWLLVLDEPTNHLDLPSIERLEEALSDYEGALVLVTHDDDLAASVTTEQWTVPFTDVVHER